MDLRVRLDEIVPVKTAARELPQVLDRLSGDDVEHLVITRRNQPKAVLVSVERYTALLSASTDQPVSGER
jgi:prevent-host-death family protein